MTLRGCFSHSLSKSGGEGTAVGANWLYLDLAQIAN